MMILIHRICMALRGLGSLRKVEMVIREMAAMLLIKTEKKYYHLLKGN
jgi:hypothetical protein